MRGTMGTAGTLLGYFVGPREAGNALRALRKRGFRRAAILSRNGGGDAGHP
jgi:hypothetical protein